MGKFCAIILLVLLLVGCSVPIESYPAKEVNISVVEFKIADWCECDVFAWTTNVETMCTVSFCYADGMCCSPEEEPEYSKLHILILPKGISSLTIELEDREGLKITWHP